MLVMTLNIWETTGGPQDTRILYTLDILFCQISTFIKVHVTFVFWLHFTKIYQLKGLEPKNKDCTYFYECCDLTKK